MRNLSTTTTTDDFDSKYNGDKTEDFEDYPNSPQIESVIIENPSVLLNNHQNPSLSQQSRDLKEFESTATLNVCENKGNEKSLLLTNWIEHNKQNQSKLVNLSIQQSLQEHSSINTQLNLPYNNPNKLYASTTDVNKINLKSINDNKNFYQNQNQFLNRNLDTNSWQSSLINKNNSINNNNNKLSIGILRFNR